MIGVDIPIGFPALPAQGRAADGAARQLVKPLTSTVFPTPHPAVHEAQNHAQANDISRKLTGTGISKASFDLLPKIREVQKIAVKNKRIYEVHPEVSFRILAGRPLVSKKRWNGHTDRRALLLAAGVEIPDYLGDAKSAGAYDILDAAVAAWSANRIAAGEANSLPHPPERDENGREIAIWY